MSQEGRCSVLTHSCAGAKEGVMHSGRSRRCAPAEPLSTCAALVTRHARVPQVAVTIRGGSSSYGLAGDTELGTATSRRWMRAPSELYRGCALSQGPRGDQPRCVIHQPAGFPGAVRHLVSGAAHELPRIIDGSPSRSDGRGVEATRTNWSFVDWGSGHHLTSSNPTVWAGTPLAPTLCGSRRRNGGRVRDRGVGHSGRIL
jgi:hypothetical protein